MTLLTAPIQRSPGFSFKWLLRRYIVGLPDTDLIHVGKCGGLSLRGAFDQVAKQLPVHVVHIKKPIYYPRVQYVIVARDPISRLISAFNWRYLLVVEEERPWQRHKIKGEYEVLKKYKSLNGIAEELYDQYDNANLSVHREIRKIRHIREDIGFYLFDFVKRCPPHQIVAVFMQETLDADVRTHLGINLPERKNDNSKSSRENALSQRAMRNLRRFFHDDYAALLKLYCDGKIAPQTYEGIIQRSCHSSETTN